MSVAAEPPLDNDGLELNRAKIAALIPSLRSTMVAGYITHSLSR